MSDLTQASREVLVRGLKRLQSNLAGAEEAKVECEDRLELLNKDIAAMQAEREGLVRDIGEVEA